jgi:two-component system cell cycle response regulator
MLTRRDVFNKLNETQKLPSPSAITIKVIALCNDETTSIDDIARVIQTDPALSAELLKFANAAFLATGIQVASVQKAAIKIGMRTVVNLTLGLSLLSNNKKGECRTFDYEKFWSTSLLQAIAAKNIAAIGKEFDPEEIFICALLSHTGQLALASLFPQEYGDILNEFEFESCGEWGLECAHEILSDNPSNLLRKTLEKEQFQIDSSELTVELFLDWGLPAPYALAAGFHDDLSYVELGTGVTRRIAELLNLSHQIAKICLQEQPRRELLNAIEKTAQKFNIDGDHFGAAFDAIVLQWHEWSEIFKIKTYHCPLYSTIMAEKTEEIGS